MVPEELVQGGMFIKPDDFLNRNKGNSIRRDFNKEMLGNKHIFRSQLWQCRQVPLLPA